MSDTGAFRALARYLGGDQRCAVHPRCVLPAGHDGPPTADLPRTPRVIDPGEVR